jgi:hypothetical protein
MNQCPECLEFFRQEKCTACAKVFLACGCSLGYCPGCEDRIDEEEIEYDYTQDGDGCGLIPIMPRRENREPLSSNVSD